MGQPSRTIPERQRPGPARGFTLTELMIVMVIIGIILSLILTVAMGGVRRAEERATQGLISKLETGLDDRLQALLQIQPDYNSAHYYMAQVYNGTNAMPGLQRVNVIARYDQVKAEIPDVFLFNPSATANYPLNFAAHPFPGTPISGYSTTDMPYILPLGHTILNAPSSSPYGDAIQVTGSPPPDPYGTGIYGASYTAAAGFYKNFGSGSFLDTTQKPPVQVPFSIAPAGYDGTDNDSNGLIDDIGEGTKSLSSTQSTHLLATMANHTHKTARSEALYALLVEGQGPLGSVFNREDFTDKEVQDTDGDGLPEFVDAWGEPLQFYRWPIYHHSDLQRGVPVNNNFNAANSVAATGGGLMNYPYLGVFDPREQDPLDPSQQLLAPSWWSAGYNTGVATIPGSVSYTSVQSATTYLSPGAAAFSTFFHPLMEPMISAGAASGTTSSTLLWDRGGTYTPRRAFFSKFLIVSSGLDRMLGIARLDTLSGTAVTAANFTGDDLLIESQARQMNFYDSSNSNLSGKADTIPTISSYGSTSLSDAAQDDISNHNYQAPGGIVQ